MNDRNRPISTRLFDWASSMELALPKSGETCVFRVDLDPRPKCDDLEQLSEWSILSEEERARASRFVRPRDGRRFAVCRGSLRLILGRLMNALPQDVAFRFGAGGKPELAGPERPGDAPSPRFNLSHSDDLALIAVSLDRELGVDLERLRTISEAARIVESYFTLAEQAQFAALEEAVRPSAFLRGWTRKEAILKAKGVGLAGLANSYETMFGTAELTDRFSPASPLPRIGEWWLWEASPSAGYFAALAVQDLSRSGPNCLPSDSPPHDHALHGKQGET
jgi:4'-phosphopantetheinyl transferase